MIVYLARQLLPVSSRPVDDGAVAIDGRRIVAAGTRQTVLDTVGGTAEQRDLGNVALLPGLVNAHTHLELSWMVRPRPVADDYVSWVRDLLRLRAERTAADPREPRAAAAAAIELMIRRGTVAVGDISNEGWTAALLARSELHAMVFHELYGLRADGAERTLDEAADRLEAVHSDDAVKEAGSRVRVGLTPHAPHTTSPSLLRALAGRARACEAPLSIHVAESEAESTWLRDGGGPLAGFYRERGFMDEGWTPPGLGPLAYLGRLGVLDARTLAVHCVQVDRTDHALLQRRGVTVVTCPRSNAFLGVGRAPIPEFLREGIPVAIGTDSLASAPDLDLFAEMSALVDEHPALAPAAVLRMATWNGARALGFSDRLGTIEPGKLAELVVVELPASGAGGVEVLCSNPDRVWRLDRAPWEPTG